MYLKSLNATFYVRICWNLKVVLDQGFITEKIIISVLILGILLFVWVNKTKEDDDYYTEIEKEYTSLEIKYNNLKKEMEDIKAKYSEKEKSLKLT